ncbi:flagellar biosynthesis anti-sigma factor FlgM [Virgibacillus sp. W0181]|uniref:flagellar biosynthesis anti-sigma factor FlgM n=1 Tax=Virgibacillus sp. W0181 TaxID=3391581 RepID=UPI003F4552AE
MKIQGSNFSNLNAYKNHLQKPLDKHKTAKNDELNISNEAKQLQENNKTGQKRTAYVQEIKKAVDTGEYTVNPERSAQKMIDFWSKRI